MGSWGSDGHMIDLANRRKRLAEPSAFCSDHFSFYDAWSACSLNLDSHHVGFDLYLLISHITSANHFP